MAMVVFLLFAIAVAGATGYQLVQLEAQLATQGREGNEALEVAMAGVHRFVGASYGVPNDSSVYYVGNGTVTVLTRRLARLDSVRDLYLIRSTGSVENDFYPDAPARRTVSQYAVLHKDPVGVWAALTMPRGLRIRTPGTVSGLDTSSPGACALAGVDRYGAMLTAGASTQGGAAYLLGSPSGSVNVGGIGTLLDTARVRWDVLSDASFAIVDDDVEPDWVSIPADSFPVYRVNGDLTAGSEDSGRGVLIVTGALSVENGFTWSGIILAGALDSFEATAVITGALLGNLDGGVGRLEFRHATIQYDACTVMSANASIAYLELLDGTLWEEA